MGRAADFPPKSREESMMDGLTLEDVVRKFDLRFDRIEQFLPTLATRAELQAATDRLATKAELQAVAADLRAELATKAELQEGLDSVKTELRTELATKADLQEGLDSVKTELRADWRANIRAESVETRRYMKILHEDVLDHIRIICEGLGVLDARDARQHADRLKAEARLDVRVMALEAGRRRARPR
jgi:hypothetical protein